MRHPGRPIAGLAATVVVAGATMLMPSQALAFSTSGVATVAGGPAVVLSAGVSDQPISNLTISFTDSTTAHVWSANDAITVQLWDATAGAPLSQTTTNLFEAASFAAVPTAAATNGVDASYLGLTLARGATSSVDDEFRITFNKDAPQDANTTKFTISGLALTLGSRIPLGHQVQLKISSDSGTPFTGATSIQYTDAGSVPGMALTSSSVVTGPPMSTGLGLGRITLTDTIGGSIDAGDQVDLTLTSGFWASAGTVSGTIASSSTLTSRDHASDTLRFTAAKTSAKGDSLSVSLAKLTMSSDFGEVYVVARDETTSTLLGAVGVAVCVNQARIGGADRYSTASQLFDLEFSSKTSAVLTSGTNYPDALSAVYLARQLKTGVLTTDPTTLSAATRAELLSGSISTVYIVGGAAAVTENVAMQIESLHIGDNPQAATIQTIRVAGADRYETNVKADTFTASSGSDTAIIATGTDFADALAVGPAVYKTGDPLILVDGDTLSTSAKATIDALGITHAVIVGGTSAVSFNLELALGAAGVTVDYRIAGTDRTQTAADVATWETDGLPAYDRYEALAGLGFSGTSTINVVRGDSFADALAAGSVAGAEQGVIVLTASPDSLGAGVPAYFAGRAGVTSTVRGIGLTSALSNLTLDQATASLTEPATF